jgi:hypothetical protein
VLIEKAALNRRVAFNAHDNWLNARVGARYSAGRCTGEVRSFPLPSMESWNQSGSMNIVEHSSAYGDSAEHRLIREKTLSFRSESLPATRLLAAIWSWFDGSTGGRSGF